MAEISKISAVAIANVAKVDAVTKANIADINGLTIPSAAAFLLDTYTGATAAYSVRRLNSLYTGACMRVRRSSDNTEQDIGFDSNGDLDTSALATFVGSGNDGFVRYWYDQSTSGGTGSGNDAGQATAGNQPQIYNGTAVITENGKPALDFDNDELNSSFNLTSDQTVAAVVTSHVVGVETLFGSAGGVAMGRSINNNAFYQSSIDGDTDNFYGTFVNDQQQLHFVYRDSVTSTNSFGRVNGTEGALDIDGTGTVSGIFAIGQLQQLAGYSFDGFIQELILWNDQSSNRTGIESDINDYFSIYT